MIERVRHIYFDVGDLEDDGLKYDVGYGTVSRKRLFRNIDRIRRLD